VKTKKQDIDIEELFRRTLGEAEVIPEVATGSNLMRQVARREFIRFNPGRFNIYYLGALIVAGITVTVIFTSGNDNSAQTIPADQPTEIGNVLFADSSKNIDDIEEITQQENQSLGKQYQGQDLTNRDCRPDLWAAHCCSIQQCRYWAARFSPPNTISDRRR